MAELLLQRGADANAYSDSSGTCITIVEAKHPKHCEPMQELLRQHGAFMPSYALDDDALEQKIKEGGPILEDEQLLHEVMGRDSTGPLNTLLKKSPAIIKRLTLTDIWGGNHPPNPHILRDLHERGVDFNRANWIGRTFLHSAAEKGDIEAARLLLELGADIDVVELGHGSTPLGGAARKGQVEMVRFLLEAGANPKAPIDSPWGQPLAQAKRAEQAEVAELLSTVI